jgi:hypothetical protein
MDNLRRCATCRAVLAQTSRHDRRYCSAACRQAAYEQRKAGVDVTPKPVAEVVPIAPNGRLDEALARALDPKRLLAIVAAHAGAQQPTSWRAALALLAMQGVTAEAGEAPAEPVRDVWLELDELAAKRAGTSVAELRAAGRRRRRTA